MQLGGTLSQLARKEDVAELRGAVDAHRGVGLLGLEIFEIQTAGLVGIGGRSHDAASDQAVAQQAGEQERREVVQRKGTLEALGGLLPRGEQSAGVVGQDIDVLVAVANLLREPADIGHQHQIGDVLMDGRSSDRRPGLLRDGSDALALATHNRHLCSLPSKVDRGGAADPRVAPVSRTRVTPRILSRRALAGLALPAQHDAAHLEHARWEPTWQ